MACFLQSSQPALPLVTGFGLGCLFLLVPTEGMEDGAATGVDITGPAAKKQRLDHTADDAQESSQGKQVMP